MRKLLLSTLLLLGVSTLSAQSTVYSNSNFSGWFLGTQPTISGGDLITTASTTNAALTYFTPSGSPYQMTLGETLTLTTNFTMVSGSSVSVSRGFYLTLQNSGGSRVSGTLSTTNTNGTTFNGYTGYGALINPAPSSAQAGQINYRATANSAIAASTAAWSAVPGISAAPSGTYSLTSAGSPTYTFSLNLTWATADTMSLSYSLTNGATTITSYSGTSTSLTGNQLVTAFDTIAIGNTNAQTGSFKYFDTSLTSSLPAAPVPEPATFALAAGALGLVYAGLRRRSLRAAL